MYIKQVIISGFRSFRSQNEIEPFSPKHNVIVGRNGSGKSNFFDAIQFVLLGPKFSNLRQEDRQHLLHEGAGTSVMAAFVEIVFDNSDGRLSIDGDEVILRRTVGHKKDEFFLNRKRVQKSEVMSLLESAGLSKSNPYYIVQQGKVANLCVMKDKDRLDLLKGVAGTTVYEERRAESMKIIQDTEHKKEKVEEVLALIEERLGELEREKAELTEYENLDRQRRALDYTLYERQCSKAEAQLHEMEKTQVTERGQQAELYNEFGAAQDELGQKEDQLTVAQSALDRLVARREAVAAEVAEAVTRRSAIEVELQETEAAARASKVDAAQYGGQLQEVRGQVREAEEELRRIEPLHQTKAAQLEQAEAELATVRTKVEALYGKQGRGTQFRSKAERDRFLQTQIDSLDAQIQHKTALLARTTREVAAEEARLKGEREHVDLAQRQQRTRAERVDEVTALIRERTQQRNELQEGRKSTWRELETLQERVQDTRQELEKAKQQLNRSLPRQIAQGLAAVKEIVERLQLRGYHGPLIDLIELTHDNFRVPVEVAAGNSLFHVVVDDDKVAARLIEELDRLKAGRLTFLPLNQLREASFTYPESDAHPMKDKCLRYDPRFRKAIDQVFGKKLLVRDLDAAAVFSKEFNLDAITPQGDQVSSKGGFEGGFHDERASKFGAFLRINEYTAQLDALVQEERAKRAALEQVEARVNEAVRELQQLETERAHLRQNGDQLTREIKNRASQLEAALAGLETQKRGITTLQQQIQVATTQQESFRAEQASQLVEKLSASERTELTRLEERQRALQTEAEALEKEVMEVSTNKERLLADLDGNLRRRKDELERTLAEATEDDAGARDYEGDLANLRINQEHCKALIATAKKELKELDETVAKRKAECDKLEKEVEEQREASQALQESIDEVSDRLDKLLNKRSMLRETVHTKQRMMRDLGTIVQGERNRVRDLSEKQLEAQRDKVSQELRKYSKVNRKAIEQYISFNDRRVELVKRKEEMDRDSVAIQQLVESLDNQKDEAILRTFRGVSHHFSEVFAELVPGGMGQLVMRTSLDAEREREDDTLQSTDDLQDRILNGDTEGDRPAISTFQGVQVRVSFTGAGQQYQMQQLSGGQKALVALALIFAIQRCDPSPFYLFDEIDQALDANYRTGVARLIEKQVHSRTAAAQFITTTFRPELVAVADKCYGIGLKDKVSKIDSLEKSAAQDFVTNLMLEEEAVGQVTALPGRRATGTGRGPTADSESEQGEDGSDEEGGESPPKVRRTGRGGAAGAAARRGKGSTAPAAGRQAKGGARKASSSSRGRGRVASASEEEESEEEFSEDDVSDEEGEDRAGMIELDEEEAAALSHLDLHDVVDDDAYDEA